MTNQPLVSILAICYNHTEYLEETLDSIINQSYSNIQLIIVDDCSTDNSIESINKWIKENKQDCVFIEHKKNQGVCKTINEGLTHVKGVFYQVVACDDILLTHKIEKQVVLFEESSKDVAVVYSDAYLIGSASEPLYGRFIQRHKQTMTKVPEGDIFEELLQRNFIPAMSVLIKTEIFRKLGLYDENLLYEDYDCWLRLSKEYKFVFSDYVSSKYRLHESNFHVSDNFKVNRLRTNYWIYRKHIDHPVAKFKFDRVVLEMYSDKNKQRYFTELKDYVSLSEGSFLSKSIKYKLPYFLYKFVVSLKKKIKGE